MKELMIAMTETFGCGEAEAKLRAEMYEMGRQAGVIEGRAEAQRFFRLAIGDAVPTDSEAALWNNPVPLKKGD